MERSVEARLDPIVSEEVAHGRGDRPLRPSTPPPLAEDDTLPLIEKLVGPHEAEETPIRRHREADLRTGASHQAPSQRQLA